MKRVALLSTLTDAFIRVPRSQPYDLDILNICFRRGVQP